MKITTSVKNNTLLTLARLLAANEQIIFEANQADLNALKTTDETLIDRLKINPVKIQGMIRAIEEVIALEDPTYQLISTYEHPNGIQVTNRTVPFGKILIIYESRPDVTIEAAINAFKAGNQIYLKGGKEALQSNLALIQLWHLALEENGLQKNWVNYLNLNREETQLLLKENTYRFDLIIPRGGETLIQFIQQNTAIPLLISGRGNNFVFVDESADLTKARAIISNGKSRLSVCNAIDKVIFHSAFQTNPEFIAAIVAGLNEMGTVVYGEGESLSTIDGITPKTDSIRYEDEFLAPILLMTFAPHMDEAINLINTYSGGHSAVIITENALNAEQFQYTVDCAAVYHNASSRFTDGGEFGMGAEIAISTQKLHFRGPVGMAQLVTNKWFISGTGQIR